MRHKRDWKRIWRNGKRNPKQEEKYKTIILLKKTEKECEAGDK